MGLCVSSGPTLQKLSIESPDGALLSLWDMLRFSAAEFVTVTHNLELVRNRLLDAEFANLKLDWNQVQQSLRDIHEVIQKLPLSLSLQAQVKRTFERASQHDSDDIHDLRVIVGEISHNIVSELASHLFFFVASELKWHYLTPERVVGQAFEMAFPDAVKDSHLGIQCYVLDQWTASVFHFMRVLEHGIRHICSLVEIPSENIQLENWKNILDQVEKKIREMEKLPRSEEKVENLKFLSEAATNFRYFKDAWRNHVSHSRATYDSIDAKRVMDHVIDFMQHLAKQISAI
jgi:hypothetical protein